MTYASSTPVRRVFFEQVLSTSYGATLKVPVGARDVSVTLSDSAIGFIVQDQAAGTPEEGIPAGSSWELGNDDPLGVVVDLKIKSASGTPTALLAYFLPVAIS